MTAMKNYIQLHNIKIHAFHGVLEQERKNGNDFLIDLKLYFDFSKAVLSDNLNDTVNYATVYALVKEEMNIPSNLLEHVAGRIAAKIKHEFPAIEKVKIKLSKLNPPIGGEVSTASVQYIG
jgi:dihydroneopterin aldolase